jgi:hypothetical protein
VAGLAVTKLARIAQVRRFNKACGIALAEEETLLLISSSLIQQVVYFTSSLSILVTINSNGTNHYIHAFIGIILD